VVPRQLLVPDISSASEDLNKLRNRDLDVSLKELDRVIRAEKERQDRLVKIQRIQKYQHCTQQIKMKTSEVERSISTPSVSCLQEPDQEKEEDEEEEEEEEEEDQDPGEDEQGQEESSSPTRSGLSSQSAPPLSFQPILGDTVLHSSTSEPSEHEEEVVVHLIFNKN
jgi:hypothetical protein